MKNLQIDTLSTPGGNTANNQVIITDTKKGKIAFFSYETLIAIYDCGKKVLKLSDSWMYSNTTSRYLKQFVNDYTSLIYDSRKSMENMLLDKDNKSVVKL